MTLHNALPEHLSQHGRLFLSKRLNTFLHFFSLRFDLDACSFQCVGVVHLMYHSSLMLQCRLFWETITQVHALHQACQSLGLGPVMENTTEMKPLLRFQIAVPAEHFQSTLDLPLEQAWCTLFHQCVVRVALAFFVSMQSSPTHLS